MLCVGGGGGGSSELPDPPQPTVLSEAFSLLKAKDSAVNCVDVRSSF